MLQVRCYFVCSVLLLVGNGGCVSRGKPAAQPMVRDRALAENLNQQGLTLIVQGEFAEAGELFEQALWADPYFGPAHCNLGISLLQQGKYFDAGWALRHASQLMPKASQPRANLGLLYESVGRYGPAEEQYRDALRLSPDDIEVIGHLARVHVRQDKWTPETLAWLTTISEQDDHPAWRQWAGLQLIQERNSEFRNER